MKMVRFALLLIVAAIPAEAHGTLPGGGGFYSGALHPFAALGHLVALLAGGLLLGRQGMRRPLWALAGGLMVGLWLGGPVAGLQTVLLAATLGFGIALALQVRLPEGVCTLVLLGVGMAVGIDTDLPPSDAGVAMAGVCVAVFLITMNAFALGTALTGPRASMVLRVSGAWMLTVAMMVLALNLRGLA